MVTRKWNSRLLAGVAVASLGVVVGLESNVAQAKSLVTVRTLNTTFHPPTQVLAPTIAGDSPASPWYFPTDPVSVIREISTWLNTATPVSVKLPTANQNLVFNAYIGPAQLTFTDATGQRFTILPASYLGHNSRGYHPVLVPDVVEYKQGQKIEYLQDSKLYRWLANDAAWQSQFTQETWTNADKSAIHDAKASGWGMTGLNLFPALPGINDRIVKAKSRQSGRFAIGVPVTVESTVQALGHSRRVTFTEVWGNGSKSHRWNFVVGPVGRVLEHSQSGEVAPQV